MDEQQFNNIKNAIITWNRLATWEGVAVFESLGKDSVLVAPKPPHEYRYQRYFSHLATFMQNADKKRVDEFWQKVGETGLDLMNKDPTRTFWMSTSGRGVSWLHLRFDTRPKYYQHAPYKLPLSSRSALGDSSTVHSSAEGGWSITGAITNTWHSIQSRGQGHRSTPLDDEEAELRAAISASQKRKSSSAGGPSACQQQKGFTGAGNDDEEEAQLRRDIAASEQYKIQREAKEAELRKGLASEESKMHRGDSDCSMAHEEVKCPDASLPMTQEDQDTALAVQQSLESCNKACVSGEDQEVTAPPEIPSRSSKP